MSATEMKASVHSCFCILVVFAVSFFFLCFLFFHSCVIYSERILNRTSSLRGLQNNNITNTTNTTPNTNTHQIHFLLRTISPLLLSYCPLVFSSLYAPRLLCIVNLPHFLFLPQFPADTLCSFNPHTLFLS